MYIEIIIDIYMNINTIIYDEIINNMNNYYILLYIYWNYHVELANTDKLIYNWYDYYFIPPMASQNFPEQFSLFAINALSCVSRGEWQFES